MKGIIDKGIHPYNKRMERLIEWNSGKPNYLPVTEQESEWIEDDWIMLTRSKNANYSKDLLNLWDTPLLVVDEKVINQLFDE